MSGVSSIPSPPQRVLLVEPDSRVRRALAATLAASATVEAHADFEPARERLDVSAPDLLVTNLRLRAFNGLHLAYVAQHARLRTRAVVYSDQPEAWMTSEVRRAGAFFELAQRVPIVLRAYLGVQLPPADRRDPARFDRRGIPRGGRRMWDHHVAAIV
ncbi:MAG TPA: hypothetical protein VFA27_17525 [Vicinamibacterales bacterium]|nr:hypothetical protein [Vicinamibacterales bacterium]